MSSSEAKGKVDVINISAGRGVTDTWLKMQQSSLNTALFPNYDKLIPDFSKLVPSVLTDSTADKMAELTRKITAAMAPKFVDQHREAMQKMLSQATGAERIAKQINDNQTAIFKMIDPSLGAIRMMQHEERFQKSMAAMASSFASTIDASQFQDILASASKLREQLAEEDLEEIDDFFESHPELAGDIDESPALYVLTKTDRALIVWFVRIVVALYVGAGLLIIGTDSPELKAVIDAFGLDFGGGLPAGWAAGEIAKKALDQLPQEEQ
ncbi:hypothetical protein AB4Y77_11770 [Paenarthrobacter sp. YAF11_1]|uniref:hypothetical protein n=1 Tax=Paenarthrobacter sp. YAF11_1 TaxID=3233074 RepID=UPI003F9B24CD